MNIGKITRRGRAVPAFAVLAAVIIAAVLPGCRGSGETAAPSPVKTVPHQGVWGIYAMDLVTQDVRLVYSTDDEIYGSALRLNGAGDRFVFAQKAGGAADEGLEIFSIGTDGGDLTRLTNNSYLDVYPAWSPDGARIAFLSRREKDLDIYVMDADRANAARLYDSGYNDGDIDWSGSGIVFTSQFAVWKIAGDGTRPVQVTDPPLRGEWGQANLPAGDYDPRWRPDGAKIAFERLEDTGKPNGGYDLFVINADGTGETRLTDTGYAQGLASWSHAGDRIVYSVAAINGVGKYDIYLITADGTDNRDITPDYFPSGFLCHSPVFSRDDTELYFIGQWWQ